MDDPKPKSTRRRETVLWLLLGLAISFGVALVVLRLSQQDPMPPLEPADFHRARERWATAGAANYDIEVVVTGSQPATYRVEVRDGAAQAAWRNGNPLNQKRTFATWSVPGMFDTMSRDVANLELHNTGKAEPTTPRLTLRATFEPRYGYPATYRRIEWGSPVEVSWEVTGFEIK